MLCRNPVMIFYFKSLQTDVTRHTCSGVALRLHDERQENFRSCSFAISWKTMIKANILACNFSVGWFYYHGSGTTVMYYFLIYMTILTSTLKTGYSSSLRPSWMCASVCSEPWQTGRVLIHSKTTHLAMSATHIVVGL